MGNVPDHAYAAQTEGVQHTLYRWLAAPAIVLGALVYLARRTENQASEGEEE